MRVKIEVTDRGKMKHDPLGHRPIVVTVEITDRENGTKFFRVSNLESLPEAMREVADLLEYAGVKY